MLLIPVYAKLLLGDIQFDVWLVGQSVILYLGVPLFAGMLRRFIGVRKFGEKWFYNLKFYCLNQKMSKNESKRKNSQKRWL